MIELAKGTLRLLLFNILSFTLFGCASSEVSRDAAANMDMGVKNAKGFFSGDTNIDDSYGNASQATKGALLGGAAGAITGGLSSAVGMVPGTAVGAILGASYGSYIDSKTTLRDRLDNRGANVIVLGDQILIVIPSARLFEPMTANLKPQAYDTLQLVANYINQYTTMLVKVSAYTASSGSPSGDLALSSDEAQQVSKALQLSGVNARVLYAEGYGGTHLVTNNASGWDESDNYRIEITLEKLYV